MFIGRVQQRKNRSFRVTVAVTLVVLGVVALVIVLAGSDPHGGAVTAAPAASSAAAAASPQSGTAVSADDAADPAAVPPTAAEQHRLADLQAEIEKSTQELGTLRAAADHARAEVTVLHERRDAMLQQPTEPRPGTAEAPVTPPPPPVQAVQPAEKSPVHGSAAPVEHRSVAKVHNPHTARDFLRLAREALTAGRTGAAADALEKAETRALNNNAAFQSGLDPTDSPLVDRIAAARRALNSGKTERALRLVGGPLPGAAQSARDAHGTQGKQASAKP